MGRLQGSSIPFVWGSPPEMDLDDEHELKALVKWNYVWYGGGVSSIKSFQPESLSLSDNICPEIFGTSWRGSVWAALNPLPDSLALGVERKLQGSRPKIETGKSLSMDKSPSDPPPRLMNLLSHFLDDIHLIVQEQHLHLHLVSFPWLKAWAEEEVWNQFSKVLNC